MTKGYIVRSGLKVLGDDGREVMTGFYAVAKDDPREAEDSLIRFLSQLGEVRDSGITACVMREMTNEEASDLGLMPGQIRQRG